MSAAQVTVVISGQIKDVQDRPRPSVDLLQDRCHIQIRPPGFRS
jgi:hypothetical protein